MYEEPPFDTVILLIGTSPKKTIRVQIDLCTKDIMIIIMAGIYPAHAICQTLLSALHVSSYLLRITT